MTSQVENWSYSSREVSIQIPVGIAYGSDIDLAERLMLEAARGANRVLADRPPGVLLSAFGPNSIDMVIVCWIGDPEEGVGNVRSEVLKRVWHLFRENGIEIPYPQQDVSLKIGRATPAGRCAGGAARARDPPEPAPRSEPAGRDSSPLKFAPKVRLGRPQTILAGAKGHARPSALMKNPAPTPERSIWSVPAPAIPTC
jgi:hypothetical protein